MSNITQLKNIPDISFIDNRTIEDVQSEMISDFQSKYKELTGNEIELSLADPSRLILNACALQIFQCLKCIDSAGKSNLLKYAKNEYLDNIAAFKGLKRMEPTSAKTTIRFTLSNVMTRPIAIPGGTRITGNSNLYFYTDEYVEIAAGEAYVDVSATCAISGEIGNDILEGTLNVLVDSVAYIDNVKNLTITSGGADEEDDDSLTERTYLEPSSYSTAGPEDAYIYWVKSYNSQINDVKVDSPTPCVVDIYILLDGELPTQTIIDGISDFLATENVRPMCDQVSVLAPIEDEYTIDLKYYINNSDVSQAMNIQVAVEKAIDEYIKWQRKIGRDINPSKLISFVIEAGAKRVEVTSPTFSTMDSTHVAKLINSNISYGGIEND